jgi:hypothetical protein
MKLSAHAEFLEYAQSNNYWNTNMQGARYIDQV